MRGGHRRNRVVLLAAVASAAAIAGGCALLVVDEARVKSIPGLSVGVFGTFLTSMAIIAAFSIEEGSRWPTPWEALDRAHVPAWFAIALGSVVTALLAGALDSSFLSAFSLTLALAAVPLGTWGLWGLISLSSDQGRWRLVVDLLAQSILRAPPPDRARQPDLGEIDTEDHVPDSFLTAGVLRRPRRTGVSIEQVPAVLSEYADRRDLEAIVGLVDEVHASACAALDRAGSVSFEQYLTSVDTLLHVQRSVFAELANRVLSGQLGDATARIALARAGEALVDTAGRALRAETGRGREVDRVERLVARHLTALSRFAGQLTSEAERELGLVRGTQPAGPGRDAERARLLSLRTTAWDLQQAIRWAIDPDPPGMKIPPEHPWRAGLSDPGGALVWLWSAAESASGPFGVGLYALCQILTGAKFLESYWDGFDVFTEVSRRLAPADAGAAATGRAAVERAGGLELLALELGAARLAATPARRAGEPLFEGDPRRRDDRHVACNLFLAGAGYKPAGRDPVADLARLLTDRPGGSLWSVVFEQLSRLPDEALAPALRPLHRHPEACAFAICLRLAPLAERDGAAPELERFLASLPEPLLERTAAFARGLTAIEPPEPSADRGSAGRDLAAAAGFARRITPGPLPMQEAAPSRPPAAAPPPAATGAGFEQALTTIAAAGSELEVDLIQCDPRWLENWAELRAELDVALLAGALRGDLRVRRILLYDLPQDAERHATRLHYRWTNALAAAVRCFPRGGAPGAARYEARRLIPSGSNGRVAPIADTISIRAPGEPGADPFEALWARLGQDRGVAAGPGLIEL